MKSSLNNYYDYHALTLNTGKTLPIEELRKLSKEELIKKVLAYYNTRRILYNKLSEARLQVNYLCRKYADTIYNEETQKHTLEELQQNTNI